MDEKFDEFQEAFASGDYESVVRLGEPLLAEIDSDEPEAAAFLNDRLGQAYEFLERFSESESYLRRALALSEATTGCDSINTMTVRHNLAGVLRSLGRLDEAAELYASIMEHYERTEEIDTLFACTLNDAGVLERDLKDHESARELFSAALGCFEDLLPPDDPHLAGCLINLAATCEAMNRLDEAEAAYARVLRDFRETFLADPENRRRTVEAYGNLLATRGREHEAAKVRKKSAKD